MNWFMSAFKKYATFSGRARRKEYWMFALFVAIFSIAATIVDTLLGLALGSSFPFVSILVSLAMVLPGLSVTVRRLHDIGKRGSWMFITLVPIVGSIWLLTLLCKEGIGADNNFGVNPKAIA